jgi:hypothetical protein
VKVVLPVQAQHATHLTTLTLTQKPGIPWNRTRQDALSSPFDAFTRHGTQIA